MEKIIFATITLVLIIVACSSESDQYDTSFAYPDTIELSEIGSISGTDNQVFGRPLFVLPLENGEFIIADSQTHSLHLFDSDLTYQHSFGRSGNGPGEFQRFSDLSVHQSLVTVYDGRRSIISKIKVGDGRLSLAASHNFTYTAHPDHPAAMFWRFIEGENGEHIALYYDFNINSQEQLTYHKVVAFPYDENYQPIADDPVAVFTYNPELNVEDNIVLHVPFIRRGLISSLKGKILYTLNDEPSIMIYDLKGNHIQSIELPDISSDLTREEKMNAFDQMYANSPDPDRFRNEVFPLIPDRRPVSRSLLTDEDQRIWLRIFTDNDDPEWIIFDDEGNPLKQLTLRESHSFRNAIGNRIFTHRITDSGPEIVILEWVK